MYENGDSNIVVSGSPCAPVQLNMTSLLSKQVTMLRRLLGFSADVSASPDSTVKELPVGVVHMEEKQLHQALENFFNSGQYQLTVYTILYCIFLNKNKKYVEGFCKQKQLAPVGRNRSNTMALRVTSYV